MAKDFMTGKRTRFGNKRSVREGRPIGGQGEDHALWTSLSGKRK